MAALDPATRHVFDLVADGILVIDGGGAIAYANPTAHRVFDWPDGALLGASIDMLVPLSARSHHTSQREAMRLGPLPPLAMAGRAVSGLKRDGRTFSAHVTLTRLDEGDGTTMAVVHDLDALLHRDRLHSLATLAAGVVHDVRNSTSPIVMAAQELLDGTVTGTDAREALELILAAANDVVAIAERVRSYARGERHRLEWGPVFPTEVARAAVRMASPLLRRQTQANKVAVVASYALSTPPVIGDEVALREAVLNLIVNALDAMPSGGRLGVCTSMCEHPDIEGVSLIPAWQPPDGVQGFALIEVSDTGAGMDATTLARCCEPFFTTKGDGGTGLGLTNVFEAVRRHAGDVRIASTVGQGTAVRLLIPA